MRANQAYVVELSLDANSGQPFIESHLVKFFAEKGQKFYERGIMNLNILSNITISLFCIRSRRVGILLGDLLKINSLSFGLINFNFPFCEILGSIFQRFL